MRRFIFRIYPKFVEFFIKYSIWKWLWYATSIFHDQITINLTISPSTKQYPTAHYNKDKKTTRDQTRTTHTHPYEQSLAKTPLFLFGKYDIFPRTRRGVQGAEKHRRIFNFPVSKRPLERLTCGSSIGFIEASEPWKCFGISPAAPYP